MKLAIYGAGSLGTILGAFISKKQVEIDLISRNINHIEALKNNGAKIIGNINAVIPVKALLPNEIKEKYNIVFLMTKQLDNKKTINEIIPHLKEDGIVCTMQNGLPELTVSKIIGLDKTFGCSVEWGASLVDSGICELTSEPDSITFSLGSFGNFNEEKLNEIKNILELVGPVKVERNFIGARWSKLLVNCSFSGISAVLGCTFGEAAKNKKSRKCILRIIKECIDVAAKANIKIEPIQGKDVCKLLDYKNRIKELFSFSIIPLVIRKHRLLKASMLQDLEKGKKSEIDSINGIVCEYGKRFNFPTPYNDLVVKIIHEIESGKRKPNLLNIKAFELLR
jgi:2-dehydropantoate 2-reductase